MKYLVHPEKKITNKTEPNGICNELLFMQWDVSHINYSQFEIRTNRLRPENFKNSILITEITRFFPLRK